MGRTVGTFGLAQQRLQFQPIVARQLAEHILADLADGHAQMAAGVAEHMLNLEMLIDYHTVRHEQTARKVKQAELAQARRCQCGGARGGAPAARRGQGSGGAPESRTAAKQALLLIVGFEQVGVPVDAL